MLKTLFLFLAISAMSVFGASVTCTNQSSDVALLQSTVNAGGASDIHGVCGLGGSSVSVGTSVILTGDAQINSTASSAFVITANNVSISGLTFNGSGLYLPAAQPTGFNFVGNKIQNTNGRNGIQADGVMRSSNISSNAFSMIAPDNFASATFSSLGFGGCYALGDCTTPGVGIIIFGGLDQTTIDNNSFDLIANDAVHVGWNVVGADISYFLTKNNDISYNTFNRVHRIGLEIQAMWSWPNCGPGGKYPCVGGRAMSTNTTIKGNYFHNPFLAYVDTYAYSLALAGDSQYLNNAGIDNSPDSSSIGYGIEDMGSGVLTQGNVIAGTPFGWGMDIIYGAQNPGTTFTTQNNVLCGSGSTTNNFGLEPNSGGTKSNLYNYVAESCPNSDINASLISIAFTAPSTSATSGVWNTSVVSNLPIKNVQFFLDTATTPFMTQEIQDLNTNFTNDRKWMYHANVNGPGPHTLTAKATDVAGVTQTVTQAFVSGSPVIVVNPPVIVTPVTVGGWTSQNSGPGTMLLTTDTNGLVVTATGTGNGASYSLLQPLTTPLAANTKYNLVVTSSVSRPGIGLNATIYQGANNYGLNEALITSNTALSFTTPATMPAATAGGTTTPMLRLDITGFGTGDVLHLSNAKVTLTPVVVVVPPVSTPCTVTVTFAPVTVKCAFGKTCAIKGTYTGKAVCAAASAAKTKKAKK